MSDYKCPNCSRVHSLPGVRPVVSFMCSCKCEKVQLERILWNKVDWDWTTTAIAAKLGVNSYIVTRKRRELKKQRGTQGRKPRSADSFYRKITPGEINPALSVKENAAKLGVTGARIRQILASRSS